MGNLNKKRKKNNIEDEENKKNIKNLLCDYFNVLKYKNSTICNSNLYSESPFLPVKSKYIFKQNQSVYFALDLSSLIFSQLLIQENNLNLLSNAFIHKFSEGGELTVDYEEIQKLNSELKIWMDNEAIKVNNINLAVISDLLPKPENIHIFSEDISSINIKDSNNINTISENGSYAEEELLSNSHLKNRKTDKSLGKKLNFLNKKNPIYRHSTVNIFPNGGRRASTEKNLLQNTGSKVFPLFNFLNTNKIREITSEQSSKIILKDKAELENNLLNNNNNKENIKSPVIVDSNKISSNNIRLINNQPQKLQKDTKSPIFSPSSKIKGVNKSGAKHSKNNNTDTKKRIYNNKLKEGIEDRDYNSSDQNTQTVNRKLATTSKKAFSQEKKIINLNEYIKGNVDKGSIGNRKRTLKTMNVLSPIQLGGSPISKGKEVKFVSSKINKYALNNKKTGEIQDKDNSISEMANANRKNTNKYSKKQITNIEETQQKKKYLKIDIRQLENEEKTTEDSNSNPRPFSLEKMHLNQVLSTQNMQRCKRADLENIILAVSKSPNNKKLKRLENIKNNILTTFNQIQYTKKESLINTNDEDDLGVDDKVAEVKLNPGNKNTNLFKNMVKKAINISSNNTFSKSLFKTEFPKYEIDVSPLKLGDLPVNEVLKLLKTKNKFLFEETKEEKDLTMKIQKLTLERVEEG